MGRAADIAAAERSALCDLLEATGPDAPTLCGDWTTEDLAAHLVVRDRDLLGAPGIALPGPFASLTASRMEAMKRRGYRRLIDTIRKGPAIWWRLAPDGANLNEFFVHHEDVRRAGADTSPRPADDRRDSAIWALLSSGGRLWARRSPVGLVLRRPGGEQVTVRSGEPSVTITGEPGELLLFLNGRQKVAHVELDGAEGDVAGVRAADFGI